MCASAYHMIRPQNSLMTQDFDGIHAPIDMSKLLCSTLHHSNILKWLVINSFLMTLDMNNYQLVFNSFWLLSRNELSVNLFKGELLETSGRRVLWSAPSSACSPGTSCHSCSWAALLVDINIILGCHCPVSWSTSGLASLPQYFGTIRFIIILLWVVVRGLSEFKEQGIFWVNSLACI